MWETGRSRLDGGACDRCRLAGGVRRATVRQWQGPARALPGGGGGGAFWSVSAVGGCVCVAVGSGRPDTPLRDSHWPPTNPHSRRHAHPAAADIFPPATPVSTTDTIPHPSADHAGRAPLASCLPGPPPSQPDAVNTHLPFGPHLHLLLHAARFAVPSSYTGSLRARAAWPPPHSRPLPARRGLRAPAGLQ